MYKNHQIKLLDRMYRHFRLKLGGHLARVYLVDEEQINVPGAVATNDLSSNTIMVSVDQPDSRVMEALIHEIIEDINYRYELDLDHPTIMVFSESLYQIFSDNRFDFGRGVEQFIPKAVKKHG